jgi:nucleoside-diphosphate-sugar epimerase
MKNILLTGSSGFIGKNLLRKLVSSNFFVYAIGRKKPNFRHINFKFIKYDLKKKIILKKISKIQCIIHTAAISPENKITERKMLKYNFLTTKNIIDYAIKNKILKFIFLSSISIYGKIDEPTLSENTRIKNPSAYGLSKLKNEEYIKKSNLSSISIRLPGVVGKLSKRNLLTRILKSKKKIINAYNKNKLFNNVIHVDNLSNFIIELCNKKFKRGNIPVLVSSTKPIHFKKVMDILAKKKKIKYIKKLKNSFVINNNLAIKKFKFKPWSTIYSLKKFVMENSK